MKKRFLLQLFADDPTNTSSGNEQGAKNDTDPTKGQESEKPKGKTYTDEEVDEIINKKFAKWQKKQEEAVNQAKKLAEMSAQEKAEYERDELQKQLDELKKKDALSEMSKVARKMLSDEQITVGDNILAILVSEDAEATKKAISDYSKAFKEAVDAAVKERLKGEPPRKGSGAVANMTKEQILAIADPELRQKKMLENRHLFNF